MEVATMIVSALAAGASASLKDVGSDAVKTAYGKLKDLIATRTGRKHAVESLEEDPDDATQRKVVSDALVKAGADTDPDVAGLVRQLNEILEKLPPEQLQVIGIDIEGIKANNIRLKDIESSGSGVKLRKVDVNQDVVIENVKAGVGATKKN